jgi:hypothetical protein
MEFGEGQVNVWANVCETMLVSEPNLVCLAKTLSDKELNRKSGQS